MSPALLVFFLFVTLVRPGVYHDPVSGDQALRSTYTYRHLKVKQPDGTVIRKLIRRGKVVGNSEAVGMSLYTDYLVPFEEENVPAYMLERVKTEHDVKGGMGA